jgi:topoisomerase-4 subunit A
MDVVELEQEFNQLTLVIAALKAILQDENKLKDVMKDELRKVKKEYATERKTEIKDEITEIKIDTSDLITKENVIVSVTKEGYVKRVSLKSYDEEIDTNIKEGDYAIGTFKMFTMDTLLLFTDLGNYIYMPVHELPELKWKDLGKHISNLVNISSEENIVFAYPVSTFECEDDVTIFTKNGMVKRSPLKEFKVQRYSKPVNCMKLKDNDIVVSVEINKYENVFITTKKGYGLCYKKEEIPLTGVKSSGVKAISLKNDEVVSGHLYNDDFEYLTVITEKGTGKRIKLTEFELTSRARKGVQIIRDVKTNPYYILKTFIVNYKEVLGYKTVKEILDVKLTELPIGDRYMTGSTISKDTVKEVFKLSKLTENKQEEKKLEKENISLSEVDDQMMTIDDFLDNFEV